MAYVEVKVVEDGAKGPIREYDYTESDQSDLTAWLEELRQLAEQDHVPTQVHVIEHDHPRIDGIDCACAQLQAGRPDYEWASEYAEA